MLSSDVEYNVYFW